MKRTFYRYGNRKMYCKTTHKYVTLKQLKELVVAGESFEVLCHKTKNDITEHTLYAMMFYASRPSTETMLAIIKGAA